MNEVAKRYSLRRLLLSKLLVFILPLVMVMLIGAYFAIYHYINEAFDRSLARRVYALADQVEVLNGRVVVDLPQSAHDILEFDSTDVLYYRVVGPAGEVLAGTDDFPLPPVLPVTTSDKAFFYDTSVDEEPVRAAAFLMSLSGTHALGNVLVMAGETMDKRRRLAGEVIVAMLFPMLLVVLLMAYALSKGVDISLKPIHALRDAISKRSPQDLSPLKVINIPNEIEPLLAEVNRLMADVESLQNFNRHFLADAAHQLRTPLAAFKAQAELALRSVHDEAARATLTGLLTSLDRQSHLVGQLLALSRAESAIKSEDYSPMDLVRFAREITADWVPRALELGLDLAFEASPDVVEILGDRNSLAEALSNLLDNALRYTKRGDMVTVRVEIRDHRACLSVADTGPGVPEILLVKIFDRFYRAPGNQVDGCGLGLAIVKQIAQTHGGNAEAKPGKDGRGLEVCLNLPLYEQ
ncbi:MAG: sensor histidine kinase N-terminal domain-containing protein [Thiobacillaceae bacterium]